MCVCVYGWKRMCCKSPWGAGRKAIRYRVWYAFSCAAADENIVIVVVAMKGVMVDGSAIERGCEEAFSEKYTERKRQV